MKHDKNGNITVLRQIQELIEHLTAKYLAEQPGADHAEEPLTKQNQEYNSIQQNLTLVKSLISEFERAVAPAQLPYAVMRNNLFKLIDALIVNPLCVEVAGFSLANLLDLHNGDDILSFAYRFASIHRQDLSDSDKLLQLYTKFNNAFAQIFVTIDVNVAQQTIQTMGIDYGYYLGLYKCQLSNKISTVPILDKENNKIYSLSALSLNLKARYGADQNMQFFLGMRDYQLKLANFSFHPTYCRDLANAINLPTKVQLYYDQARTLAKYNSLAFAFVILNCFNSALCKQPTSRQSACDLLPIGMFILFYIAFFDLMRINNTHRNKGIRGLVIFNIAAAIVMSKLNDYALVTNQVGAFVCYLAMFLGYTALAIARTPTLQQVTICKEPKQPALLFSTANTTSTTVQSEETLPLRTYEQSETDLEHGNTAVLRAG